MSFLERNQRELFLAMQQRHAAMLSLRFVFNVSELGTLLPLMKNDLERYGSLAGSPDERTARDLERMIELYEIFNSGLEGWETTYFVQENGSAYIQIEPGGQQTQFGNRRLNTDEPVDMIAVVAAADTPQTGGEVDGYRLTINFTRAKDPVGTIGTMLLVTVAPDGSVHATPYDGSYVQQLTQNPGRFTYSYRPANEHGTLVAMEYLLKGKLPLEW